MILLAAGEAFMAHSVTQNSQNQEQAGTIQGNPRAALTARLWRAAERQAAEVEARIALGPRAAADAERDARVLAVLAKTLRELVAADASQTEGEQDDGEEETPEDVESLRAELNNKLRQIRTCRDAIETAC
jgi:hypothetical protein